jgi:hypothetical protein|tara:strand:- start:144 stop:413 length:270 start_codon:yes stop_codon:yes gene_type:complete
MILTARLIARMRRYWKIDDCLKQMLLEQLGAEPYPHEYTEQDIHEQSRKMIMQYNRNHTRTAINRLEPGIAEDSDTQTNQEAIFSKTTT